MINFGDPVFSGWWSIVW